MVAADGCLQAFIVTRKSAKACRPSKGALNYPASWQKNKPLLGFSQLYHFEPRSVRRRSVSGCLTGVTLIDKRYLHGCAGRLLDCFSQFPYLGGILFMAGVAFKAKRCPKVSTAICTLDPFRFFPAS